MKVNLDRKVNPNIEKYRKEDLDIAYEFAKEIHKELENFIKAVVIFGSTARGIEKPASDIDVLVVIDDVSIHLSRELIETYRLIVERLVVKISPRLHITTIRFTSFWDYIRNGDPIGINILRDGVALIDSGFFEPLQNLLRLGKIRPSEEAIWTYFIRAPNTMHNSKWHLLQATVDLYWAVIDAAHAALMSQGETPPTPRHVADMLQEKLVKRRLLEAKYVAIMKNFYNLSKKIIKREIKEIKGKDYDRYYKEAEMFIKRMREFIKSKV